MKRVFAIFVCTLILACSLSVALAEQIASSAIELDKTSLNLAIGQTYALTATLTPRDSTDGISWQSSAPSVATVDNRGLVSALRPGTADITATAGSGEWAACTVTVPEIPITSLKLDKTSLTIAPGSTYQLTVTAKPANTTDQVKWNSSNTSIATVDQTGFVTARKNGVVSITAISDSGQKATCQLTVRLIPAKSIKLNKTSLTLAPGQAYTLKTSVSPSDANDGITFKSSKTSIASVDENGRITARKNGKTTITVYAGSGAKASCNVTVRTIAVSSVKLNKSSVSIIPGNSYKLSAKISPSNATSKSVTWNSKNSAIASVDENGVVTANKLGSTTITAKAGSRTASCKVTVKYITVSSVKLNKSSATLGPSGTVQLKASVQPANARNKEIKWKSSNPSVASVDKNGLVTAGIAGSAKITASSTDGSKKSASCKVTVKYVKVSSVKLDKSKATLGMKQTLQLKPKVLPANAYNQQLKWTSSKSSVATVDENGLVTPIKEGETTITVQARDGSGKKASCKVTVKAIRATSITLNASSPVFLAPEATHQFKATVKPNNVDYPEVTWSSSKTGVATVDENGLVTAVSAGATTITAKTDKGRLSKSCVVRVGTDTPPVYRALVLGSFSTRTRSGYLPFVNNDVKFMVKGFKEAQVDGVGYASVSYVNPITAKTQVSAALQKAFGNATENDVSVIYLVTHGKVGWVYFEKTSDKLTYMELARMLKSIKGQIVVIISSCNSGSFIDQLRTAYAGDELMSRLHLLCGMQSGVSGCSLRYTDEAKSYDFFTGSLLLGVGLDIRSQKYVSVGADANKDGDVSFEELAKYTRVKTPANIKSYIDRYGTGKPFSGNISQVPEYYTTPSDVLVFGSH